MSMAKVIVVGNLGRDAELKYTSNQRPVLEFSVAATERWTDSAGNKQELTQWFRVSLWGRQAESLQNYLQKGQLVYVDGRLRVREYTDREGKNRFSLDVTADQVRLLGARGDRSSASETPNELRGQDPVADDDIPF